MSRKEHIDPDDVDEQDDDVDDVDEDESSSLIMFMFISDRFDADLYLTLLVFDNEAGFLNLSSCGSQVEPVVLVVVLFFVQFELAFVDESHIRGRFLS